MDSSEFDEWGHMEPLDAEVDAHVREYGWHATGVFGKAGAADFVYTAGRVEQGRPELICFGGIEGSHALLNILIRDREADIRPGRLEALWVAQSNDKTYDGWLVEVDQEHWADHLGMALRRARGRSEGFRCLQLVLPDDEGLFPWDEGSDANFQPVLGEVPVG